MLNTSFSCAVPKIEYTDTLHINSLSFSKQCSYTKVVTKGMEKAEMILKVRRSVFFVH